MILILLIISVLVSSSADAGPSAEDPVHAMLNWIDSHLASGDAGGDEKEPARGDGDEDFDKDGVNIHFYLKEDGSEEASGSEDNKHAHRGNPWNTKCTKI